MSVNYGSKRVVTGAHYGLRDWLAQRITGLLMALFTVALLVQVLLIQGPIGYEQWSGIFSRQWMRFITVATLVALAYHAWVGMREIFMDYIKSAGLKSGLQIFTALWLLGSVAWFVSVLWKF